MTVPAPEFPPRRPALSRTALHAIRVVAVGLVLYLGFAYAVTPELWTHHEHQPGLAHRPMVTVTAQGIPGDPINVGLTGAQDEIIAAMDQAGWHPADAITLSTSLGIGKSVVLNRAYPDAPVSSLFYDGKRQVLAFEKADGVSARRRHHVRFWPVLTSGAEGRPVWLGAASFDRGVGISHYTGQITHHIGPDLDAERALVIADLTAAHVLTTIYQVSGIGPTANGRNGGGDPYFTDGDVAIGVLTAQSETQAAAPDHLPDAPAVTAKNRFWAFFADLARRIRPASQDSDGSFED
ncbi:MAG: LssY C-terminal domain-containing protein [Beijerinckiaceae bacterium]|nr:LssY C-terminal domain-containing protein [Beijerinckiaceae bacterium]